MIPGQIPRVLQKALSHTRHCVGNENTRTGLLFSCWFVLGVPFRFQLFPSTQGVKFWNVLLFENILPLLFICARSNFKELPLLKPFSPLLLLPQSPLLPVENDCLVWVPPPRGKEGSHVLLWTNPNGPATGPLLGLLCQLEHFLEKKPTYLLHIKSLLLRYLLTKAHSVLVNNSHLPAQSPWPYFPFLPCMYLIRHCVIYLFTMLIVCCSSYPPHPHGAKGRHSFHTQSSPSSSWMYFSGQLSVIQLMFCRPCIFPAHHCIEPVVSAH